MKLNLRVFSLILILVFAMGAMVTAVDISGNEIMKKADENMNYGSYKGKGEMIIHTTSGDERVLKMEMWGQGTEESIMKYYEPQRVNGVTFLFLHKNIWSYFPRTGRVRHLGEHVKNQKMMGSSFSYDDFNGKIFDDYQSKLIKEEEFNNEKCYFVKGVAKNDQAAYDSFEAWVAEDGFRPLKVNYFKDNQQVKVMNTESFQRINGELRPQKIVMKDLEDNNTTSFEYLEMKTGIKFRPDFFNERNLKRISQS